ncbi:MAG: hypothetical protein DRH57_07455, partial [Candidatus Cloacimonadota bacterium]
FYHQIEKFLVKKANAIIVVNDILKKKWEKYAHNIEIVANYPTKSKKIVNNAESSDFIYIGGLSEQRGILQILKLSTLLKKYKFLLIGTYKNKHFQKYCENYILTNNLHNVKIIGQIAHQQIFSYLKNSKIGLCLLCPKIKRYQQAEPIKIFEYLQAGLPVIANKSIMIDNILTKNKCGITVNYDNLTEIADWCVNLIEDKKLYQSYSEHCKKIIENKYNWQNEAKKLKKLYNKILFKKILFLAYFFPPLGGAGVQRPLKFAKYLPQFFWQPYIVSVKDIEFISYDKTFLKELNGIPIYRTESLDLMRLMYILKRIIKRDNETDSCKIYNNTSEIVKQFCRSIVPIDDKIGWLPFAYIKAKGLIEHNKFSAIYATIGPYHTAITGYLLAKKYRLPLIIDYRDLWTQHPYLSFITTLHKNIAEQWERKVINFAKNIIVVSPDMKRQLITKYGMSLDKKVSIISNGWDKEDFDKVKITKQSEKIIITYTGGFYGWQTPKYFIKAILELKEEHCIPSNIKIQFIGNYFQNTKRILNHRRLTDIIEIIPQVSHQECINYLMNSNILLLFIGKQDGNGVLTGKLFEYLAADKPILAMIPPDGDAAKILIDYGNNYITEMNNIKRIKILFCQLIKDVKNNKKFIFNMDIRNRFERKNETEELVKILEHN